MVLSIYMSVRETGFVCVAVAGLLGPACGDLLAQGRVPPDALVIAHGRVVDGTCSDPINDGIIVIHEGRIIAVGEADAFEIPVEAQTIDATGMTVLPGIIDAHVHTTASPEIRRQFLEAGVTAVCDAGSPLRDLPRFEQDRLDRCAFLVRPDCRQVTRVHLLSGDKRYVGAETDAREAKNAP